MRILSERVEILEHIQDCEPRARVTMWPVKCADLEVSWWEKGSDGDTPEAECEGECAGDDQHATVPRHVAVCFGVRAAVDQGLLARGSGTCGEGREVVCVEQREEVIWMEDGRVWAELRSRGGPDGASGRWRC